MNYRFYTIQQSGSRRLQLVLPVVVILSLLAGALLAPVQPAGAGGFAVRDRFETAAYNNQDGPANWSSNWTETNDDGSATAGNVQITGGELRVSSRMAVNDADFEGAARSVNLGSLLPSSTATFSFSFRSTNLETGDTLVVSVYNGSTWTALETFNPASASGTRSYDITSYANANSAIRFLITAGFDQADEAFYADNVQISFLRSSSHTATSVLQTVQTYYIPVPEDQALQMMQTINGTAVSPTSVYVSISVNADGTVIYYDHWEDDFETAVNNPTQTTTEVWGDNNTANGTPPGYSTDYLNAGDIIILNNWVSTTALTWIDFDGGDKIASTEAIAITRTSWASGSGTLHGGSVEMLDTSVWGTRFDMPVDEAVDGYDFSYSTLAVMAGQDGTQVYRNGSLVTTLNEGGSYLFDHTVIARGDQITASAPVQANLLSGRIGSNYASDWFTIYPYDILGSSYYAPVNSEGGVNTRVYLQNPGSSAITVNWTTTAGAQTAVNLAAGAASYVTMPTIASGARFYTSGARFQAISVINSNGQANDWGYTLIPDNQLTQQAMVGWGVGRDPTSTTNPNENGSPVWVVAVGSGTMNVCADYNGDGQGALTDNNGYRYDQLLSLSNLQRAKVYDSDGDQTGMLVYLCNGSEAGNVNKIAVAWGQDPATASPGAPGLDVGTTVPPLPNFTAVKGAELTEDTNGDGKFDLGETFEYQIRVNNTGALPVPAGTIVVEDIVPTYTTYVADSTRLDGAPIADNSSGTPFPLDEGGYTINKILPIEGQFVVSFRVKIDDSLPSATTIQNNAQVSGLDLMYNPNVDIVVDPPSKIGDRVWLDIDGDGLQDSGEPGIPGVTVELNNGSCTVGVNCPTTVTNANGQYTFSGLADGSYTVIVRAATLPAGLTQTGDPDTTIDHQHSVTLGPGTTNKPYWSADFGYRGNVSIGDFVWYDIDRDGVQDGGSEVGLDGVTVNLTWAGPDGNLSTTADNVSLTTTTSNGGQYHFTGLPAGTYRVDLDETTLPGNYSTTTSDPLTLSGLAAGTNYTTADFGAAAGASIGDRVWNDMDNGGDQDAGESGIAGVRVYLDSNSNGSYDVGERYDITDANGNYLIGHLAPGTYSVRVDASTVPAGYTLTTSSPISAAVTAGSSYTTADFGYRATVLSISKTSNAGGTTSPGNTIQYTMVVRNNSTQNQTGIGVTDALPDGTAYVANSTVATGYYPLYYSDDFSSGGYTGSGSGSLAWGSNWTETDAQGGGATGGNIRVATDANCASGQCLRFRPNNNGDLIYRQADLSIATCTGSGVATLEYDYNNQITTAGNTIQVQVRTGATLQRALASYDSATNTGSGSASFTLNASEKANNTRIYIARTADTSPNQYLYIDNVRFSCVGGATGTKDNVSAGTNPDLVAGAPANLVKPEDGFILFPGQSMQVTYQVTVNNPVALASIDNTASVFSAQQLVAQQASTSDTLPLATVGNFVWLDQDGDGVQDVGEPGLQGVTVQLYTSSGTLVATQVSDASGTYSFANVTPGEYYYVQFTAPGGYAFSQKDQGGDDTLDSDANRTTGQTTIFTVNCGTTDNTRDAGFIPAPGSIGDYVWVDENGDGQQDAGEAGIANAQVTLTGTDIFGNAVNRSTTTDANGKYNFSGVQAGSYTVTVNQASLPAGLAANRTYDYDGVGSAHTAAVNLAPGQEMAQADFGYNWAPPTDTDNTTGTGMIGDRVWIDDGDGVQEPGEPGMGGVSVQLLTAGPDGVLGTADDVVASSTTTAADGSYAFDDLAAGAYAIRINGGAAPAGYTQTGDPEQPGALCTACDNRTTTPILLAPGDVYLNADFGYTPTAGNGGNIGDTLWLDSNRDNLVGAASSEPRLAGVSVALIRDLDGDGVWDAGEPVIATDITDSNGQYLFTNLPVTDGSGTDDYLVWVNDSENVLSGLVPTYDSNGTVTPNVSAVANLAAAGDSNQDFAYAPTNHTSGKGLIGDTIFYDRDASGSFTAGEGLEGVRVGLYQDANNNNAWDAGDLLLATTVSDENGNYFFGGLGAGEYVIRVDANSLPAGVTNTVDPDAGTASESAVTLTSGQVNLAQDFGYRDTSNPNSVSGTLWRDTDADGALDASEAGRFQNVTIVLRDSSGDIIATTTTDASGNYSFSNLPDGAYTVDVSDDANLLDGYWHSLGTAGSDNNSQADPYTVVLSGNTNNTTADFGYYRDPAAIGDFVWLDLDGDGIQDSGEPGLPDVEVILNVTWPGGGTSTLRTRTDANGLYSFGNLLADEDFDGAGAGEPVFNMTVNYPSNYALTLADQGGNDNLDSDGSASVQPQEGTTNTSYDRGLVRTAVIGNQVWLDENGNGYQDAGEAGIPNVTVELWNAGHTAVVASTTTDANGNYQFFMTQPGSYQVDVLASSLPTGLVQTTVIGGAADFTNKADPYAVTVSAGSENLAADFGFNWAPSGDTSGNTGTGAIGDRVWNDADGDGVQDPGEAGMAGVSVQLLTPGTDGLFGTSDDVVASTTTTGPAGNYVFDDLAAGSYVVRVNGGSAPAGYTQTGDPDQPGAACTACDSRTSTPILLAPGDVYANADFGYRLSSGGNTIGNLIFLDSNGDGNYDAGEAGIPGVTVALLDNSGNVIATTQTDANGSYSFPGLPNGTYTLWVYDTNNVLGELEQSSTPDNAVDGGQPCGACSRQNTVTVSGSGNSFQDFGFAPAWHGSGDGLIGDTIFYDRDASGSFTAGEGLEGVRVNLYRDSNGDGNYDAGEPLVNTTVSNENGNYYFGNLAAGNYVVQVDAATLPAGVTNTVDVGDATLNEGGVTLAAGEANLAQDFGYRDTSNPNSVSGTLWRDTDADGALDGSEAGRFQNVTVALRNSNGDIIATTTTDASGNYSFGNLPDGTYTVDVSDDARVLNGYWHSLGTQGEADDDQSKADVYTISLSAGENRSTVDFGYFIDGAALGNRVWMDANGTNLGIQDTNELGLPGVKVTLKIDYPGQTVYAYTLSDQNGFYSFGNLMLDENGSATYTLSMETPSGAMATSIDVGGNDRLDADNPAGVTATASKGVVNVAAGSPGSEPVAASYDFGWTGAVVDLGDLPQDNYRTEFLDGAAHIVFPDGSDANSDPDTINGQAAVWLGTQVDRESNGAPGASANGDDNADNDDEDGLNFPATEWAEGNTLPVTVTLNASESGVTVYFGLWIDWNNDGDFADATDGFYSGSGVSGSPVQVSFNVTVPATPATTIYVRLRADTASFDSSQSYGLRGNGEVEDYRKDNGPTAVTMGNFAAAAAQGQIVLNWNTVMEMDAIGFNLYRSTSLHGERVMLNSELIPSQALGGLSGAEYQFTDGNVEYGVTYFYWLEFIDTQGSTFFGPMSATLLRSIYLPVILR